MSARKNSVDNNSNRINEIEMIDDYNDEFDDVWSKTATTQMNLRLDMADNNSENLPDIGQFHPDWVEVMRSFPSSKG